MLIVLNLSDSAAAVEGPSLSGKILLSTLDDRNGERTERAIALRPNEGLVVALDR
jgi:hypothetical protein